METTYIKNKKAFLSEYHNLMGFVFWRDHGNDTVEIIIATNPTYTKPILNKLP